MRTLFILATVALIHGCGADWQPGTGGEDSGGRPPHDASPAGNGTGGRDAGMTDATVQADASRASCTAEQPVRIEGEFAGPLYIDDRYTGMNAPVEVPRWTGTRTIAIGSEAEGYLRREFEAGNACTVRLDRDTRVSPREWRARYITLRSVYADLITGGSCSATLDDSDADRAFTSFTSSLHGHFEPASLQTMKWSVERKDLVQPVRLRRYDWGFGLEPEDVASAIDDLSPGTTDLIVVFFRSAGVDCIIPGPYFAYSFGPVPETYEAGFVVVKMEERGALGPAFDFHEQNDPGVWLHEWLHTVAEWYYPGLGALMPDPAEDGSIVHAAESHGYGAPWMRWYADLISGQVQLGSGFVGIGPEWLLKCTLRERITHPECAVDLGSRVQPR